MKLLVMSILCLIVMSSALAQEIIETRFSLGEQSVDIQKVGDDVIVKLKLNPSIATSRGTVGGPALNFRLSATIGVWGALTGAQPEFYRLESSQPKTIDLIADGDATEQTFVFSRKDLWSNEARVCVQLVAVAEGLQTAVLACEK